MIELVAIILSCIAAGGSLGTTGYKCYELYKNKNQQTPITINNTQQNHDPIIEQIILDEIKKRSSGDSDTNVDIKINIHSQDHNNIIKDALHGKK